VIRTKNMNNHLEVEIEWDVGKKSVVSFFYFRSSCYIKTSASLFLITLTDIKALSEVTEMF
jgi:hypothetical protein